jgi:glucose/arabinose dehydrogenase
MRQQATDPVTRTPRLAGCGLAIALALISGCSADSPRGSVVAASTTPAVASRLDSISLPPGFHVGLFAGGVQNAREMAWSPAGVLYVGSRAAGEVHAVRDVDGDMVGDEVFLIASGLTMPSGVAYRDGSLYVAEVHRVIRFDAIDDRLADPPAPVVVDDTLPRDQHHGWKFIAFGPDGWLYVPVGMPCNVCEPSADIYGTITRMRPDGSGREIYARGVRNSVGFDWHPDTGELWFTDNGRDWLGDDSPPDELNRVTAPGQHFGFPYCHAGNIADPELGARRPCSSTVPPARRLGPHVAALGMEFYDGAMFPAEYRHQIFIAEHGSWNRSTPIGYRVSLVRLEGDEAVSYEPFAEGWLQGGKAWGRPADVEILPDGSLLVADDLAGAIYRITYTAPSG